MKSVLISQNQPFEPFKIEVTFESAMELATLWYQLHSPGITYDMCSPNNRTCWINELTKADLPTTGCLWRLLDNIAFDRGLKSKRGGK